MVNTVSTEQHDVEDLRESLRICQLELAQVRALEESLQEDAAETRNRLMSTERRFKELSRRVNAQLSALPGGSDLGSKVRRRLESRRRARSEEWRLVRTLRSSDLFSGPWYLRQYPEVVSTGLPPALHYLRTGATEGLDPGPEFSTAGYRESHPDLAASGVNPLIHHLQAQRPGPPAAAQQ
jgi:hypothetical protein